MKDWLTSHSTQDGPFLAVFEEITVTEENKPNTTNLQQQ